MSIVNVIMRAKGKFLKLLKKARDRRSAMQM
jgi:hypothetical protein